MTCFSPPFSVFAEQDVRVLAINCLECKCPNSAVYILEEQCTEDDESFPAYCGNDLTHIRTTD